jgi:hypothetical protein
MLLINVVELKKLVGVIFISFFLIFILLGATKAQTPLQPL